jgi:hypothetical protein
MGAVTHSGQPLTVWEMAEVARTVEGKALLHRLLEEITEGAAFKGSHRSAQFLEYVVQQSASGNVERLKERLIGVELFGRLPSYDTGEDAIVRVTATDVRKRLLQHYSSRAGSSSEFRISLPLGKYVAEVVRNPISRVDILAPPPFLEVHPKQASTVSESPAIDIPASRQKPELAWWQWAAPVLGLAMMILGLVLAVANWPGRTSGRDLQPSAQNSHPTPWGMLLNGSRPVLIVASDPNIEEIQRIAHGNVALSDYANQYYLPHNADQLSSEQLGFMKNILRGNKISSFDGNIIVGLAALVPSGQPRPFVKAARDTRMPDLETNGNLIFLGSPRSNPWTSIYDPVLDFHFFFDERIQQEIIRNMKPARGERKEYIPTAGGFDTGQSFAIVSIFQNPGHTGRVLIIAGANGEGTEAAGALITDPARWDMILQPCHLTEQVEKRSMQLLLQLGTMAGSASDLKVVACHVLGTPS